MGRQVRALGWIWVAALLDSQVAPCSAAPHARSPMIMQLRLGAVRWLLGVALAQVAMPSKELGGQSG
jgi:hypothetical protein